MAEQQNVWHQQLHLQSFNLLLLLLALCLLAAVGNQVLCDICEYYYSVVMELCAQQVSARCMKQVSPYQQDDVTN